MSRVEFAIQRPTVEDDRGHKPLTYNGDQLIGQAPMTIQYKIVEDHLEQNREVDELVDVAIVHPCFWDMKADVIFSREHMWGRYQVGFIQVLEADHSAFRTTNHIWFERYKKSLPVRDGGPKPPFYAADARYSTLGKVVDDRFFRAEMDDAPENTIAWAAGDGDFLERVYFHRRFSLWLAVQDLDGGLEPIPKRVTLLHRWFIELKVTYSVDQSKELKKRFKRESSSCLLRPAEMRNLPDCVWEEGTANDAEVEGFGFKRRELPPNPPPMTQEQIDHCQRVLAAKKGRVRMGVPRNE
jgi:hypothetical protein